jgi:2-polyprenyl-6-methoxyphenol hydroxylase-like FAD-dependent oxidoreductase
MRSAIVVGSGIGGLAAAIALERSRCEVLVLEQAPELIEVGAGLTLWPNGVRALAALGLGEVRDFGSVQGAGGVRIPSGRWLTRIDMSQIRDRFGEPVLGVHRADLLRLLLERARQGSEIRLGVTVRRVRQDSSGVTAVLADGSEARADIVVGADGVDSVVRRQLYPDSRSRYAGFSAWRAVIQTEGPAPGMQGETMGIGQLFGFVPIEPQRIYWFAAARVPEQPSYQGGSNREELTRRFGEWHDPIPRLVRDTPEDQIHYHPIHEVPSLPAWSVGRVTLLGDAAHAMTPNLGQGACQALEDAVALGETVGAESDPVAALAAYQRARLRRATGIAARSRLTSRVALANHPLTAALRNLVIGLIPNGAVTRGLSPILSWEPPLAPADSSTPNEI